LKQKKSRADKTRGSVKSGHSNDNHQVVEHRMPDDPSDVRSETALRHKKATCAQVSGAQTGVLSPNAYLGGACPQASGS
jgi:hypothetical protein